MLQKETVQKFLPVSKVDKIPLVLGNAPNHVSWFCTSDKQNGIDKERTVPRKAVRGSGQNSRDAILDAAEAIVRENGASHMTIEAVSARAGISKGGLLYHFRTKEILLLEMIERLYHIIQQTADAEAAKLPESPARALKAHIHAAEFFHNQRIQGLAVAFLAASAHDPKILKPAQKARTEMIKELCKCNLSDGFIKAIVFALDGMWISQTLGISSLSHSAQQEVIHTLLRLVDQEEKNTNKE